MSYIGNTPGVSSQRVVLEEVITGSSKSAFVPISGYIKGYVDVLINGVEIDTADFTAADGVTVTLGTAAAVGDTVKIKTWLPRGLSDGYLKTEADAKFAPLVNGNLIMAPNAGSNRVIGFASGTDTTLVLQGGGTSGGGANLELTRDARAFLDATTSEVRSLDGSTVYAIFNTSGIALPAGKGIDFSAGSNAAGMTGEVLDDYETGTWTPTLVGGTNPTVTYSTQRGNYVKIGRKVFASFYVSLTSFSGGSGAARIGGLPFTASSIGVGAPDDNGGSIQEHNGVLSYPSGRTWVTLYVVNGGTVAPLVANGSGVGGSDMIIGTNVVSASGYILGSVTYTSA